MKKKTELLIVIALAAFSAIQAHAGKLTYQEIDRLKLGGDGGWDYLTIDEAHHHLFIARFDRVMVADTQSGKTVTEIPGVDGAHGIAIDSKLHHGFASAGKKNEVIVFDSLTFKKIGSITVGEKPDAIILDTASNQVFAFNGKSKNVSVIDASTQKVTSTIALGGKPEFAASNSNGSVFVNIEDLNSVVAINSKTNQISHRYSIAPCQAPTGLTYDPGNQYLIVGCDNQLAVIVDANDGKVVKTFKVGNEVDATAFDPMTKRAFISAGEGILTILDASSKDYTLLQSLNTVRGARTLAVDSESGEAYLPSATLSFPKGARPVPAPGTFYVLVVGQK